MFTVSNTTGVGLAGSVSKSGADAASFALTNNTCGVSLAPMSVCNVTVTFSPSTPGAKSASLDVSSSRGPANAPLSRQSL